MRLGLLVAATMLQTAGAAGRDEFVTLPGVTVALEHVRVIDGTGGPVRDDQTLVIANGRIASVSASATASIPATAERLPLAGRTVTPGLVGMHEHLFYQIQRRSASPRLVEAASAFSRLYLAAGVTTLRTAGAIDLDADLQIKRRIDAGDEPGPDIHVTGPYLSGSPGGLDPERVARAVAAWADRGATSFKAYTTLRRSELAAAVAAAHARGLTVTGHLCAVGFRDAAAIGIDNLEHGLIVDTEFYSRKRPDECPDQGHPSLSAPRWT